MCVGGSVRAASSASAETNSGVVSPREKLFHLSLLLTLGFESCASRLLRLVTHASPSDCILLAADKKNNYCGTTSSGIHLGWLFFNFCNSLTI